MKRNKKSFPKKALAVAGTAAVLLAATEAYILGQKGRGPFSFLRDRQLAKLPGNSKEYHLSRVQPLSKSPLRGKTICFLGSSVTYGSASLQVSMADYIARLDGCTVIKEAVSGTTLSGTDSSTYSSRLLANVDPRTHIDILVCQLSTNDASLKRTLGTVSNSTDLADFDRETIIGSMEYIIAYTKATWGCDVIFYTGTQYDSEEYQAMVDALLLLKEKWNIGVIDLWNDTEMRAVSEEDYKFYMNDPIHPTQAGYLKWWVPKFQQTLYEYAAD